MEIIGKLTTKYNIFPIPRPARLYKTIHYLHVQTFRESHTDPHDKNLAVESEDWTNHRQSQFLSPNMSVKLTVMVDVQHHRRHWTATK